MRQIARCVAMGMATVAASAALSSFGEGTATLADNILASLAGEPMEIGGSTVEMTRLYNSNKLVDAQVVSYEAAEGAEGTKDLLLTVEANATATPGAYSVVTQEIRIGKDYIVKTITVEITGQILSLEKLG